MHPEYPHPDAGPQADPVGAPDSAVDASPPIGTRRQRRLSRSRRRIVATLGVLAFLTVPAVAGYEVGKGGGGSADADATSALVPSDGTGSSRVPSGNDAFGSGSTGSSGGVSADRLSAIAAAADDLVVNITSDVDGGGLAAGTGIIISSDGLVLTNNHVISGTTGLTVELSTTGVTRPAKVLGYSVVDDVALIQVQNVRNLKAADLGSSSSLSIGDAVVALGNAGGRGGEPTIVSGAVTALGQEITASDSDGSDTRTLDGLIRLAADIRSGDSGGPVVDVRGRVVGMTVAASAANGYGFPGQAGGGEGYAIPIENAVAVAKKIISGEGGPNIRVGATRAVLGLQIQPTLTGQRVPGGGSSFGAAGAQVVGVAAGSGSEAAGIKAGDTIIAIGGQTVTTVDDLTGALVTFDPGDRIAVTWRDASGQTRSAQVELGEGPPA